MAKKNKKISNSTPSITPNAVKETVSSKNEAPVINDAEAGAKEKLSIFDFKLQAIIVAILSFIIYINTYNNEYAHDDGIVIVKNEYVQEGFAGLKGIFTKDAYDSYYKQLNTVNQLAGGRYRPLSIATFAIEQQFFGATPVEKIDSVLKMNYSYGVRGAAEKKLVSDMHVRHLFSVFWYMGCVVVLLYFLRKIVLKDYPLVAFIATILFAAHPIHTEVVANVKSRDEIMSLLFMCLTYILAFNYEENKDRKTLIWAMVSYLAAFLSKEYAITIIPMLPLCFILFKNYKPSKAIVATMPYLIVVGVYFFIRLKVAQNSMPEEGTTIADVIRSMGSSNENAEKEILNNPYYFAEPGQKLPTEIGTSLNYLKLLILPHPLSADYSYNTIPYKNFGNIVVISSLIIHAILAYGIYYFGKVKKYAAISFSLAFYLVHLLLVNNIIFNIGATMGERLIFHSSVGFCIIVAWLLTKGAEKIQSSNVRYATLFSIVGVITILYSVKTIARNVIWKNDQVLFMEDIKVVPNSVLVNGNVAASYITMADFAKTEKERVYDLRMGIKLLDKAIEIHPTFVAGYLNQGIAYYKLGSLDSAKMKLAKVRELYPNYPTLPGILSLIANEHMKRGWNDYGRVGKYQEAIVEFKKGIEADSTIADLWYNLGGAYYSNRQNTEAAAAWQRALQINPNNQQARMGLEAALQNIKAGLK